MEIWKDIKNYEGLYQVSNWGRVKSLGNGKSNNSKERVIQPIKSKYGYLQVGLHKNGKMKTFKVHRLVATAFLENQENKPEVNHIDEDKTNNSVENLEWVWHRDNCNHGTHNERVAKALTNGKQSKLVLQFTLDGEFVREWSSIAECGRNGFYSSAVCNCCQGKKPQYKGFTWKYKE